MQLVPFVREHLIDLAEGDKGNPGRQLIGEWRGMADQAIRPELSWSGVHNGHLVGSGGIIPIWSGVAECWLVGGWRLSPHKVSAVRALTQTLAKLVHEHKLHRLQAVVRADWNEAVRFIEFLRFEQEGLLRRYGPDRSNHYVYSRII